ncbi:MAG: hypothetical protein IH820_15520 [Bacteroidetes bacterium]|nr:hypothetical protein [Bacteroidota bacterium]
MRFIGPLAALGAVIVFATGCGGANSLNKVDFEARTVAVVVEIPETPYFTDVLLSNTSWDNYGLNHRLLFDWSILKKDKRKPARARLDSALAYVDVTERIVSRVLIQTASHLGCRPIADAAAADYVLHIDLRRYGFQANRYTLTGFYLEAELQLIDNRTGKRIWKKKMLETERAAEVLADLIPQLGKVFIVKDLARLSVEEMVLVLETTTDFTAARLSTALRRDYYR